MSIQLPLRFLRGGSFDPRRKWLNLMLGISGLFVGAFAGVIRSSNLTLFALVSGVQWFTLGSAFMASRSYLRQSWGQDKLTPKDSIYVSAISGSIAGTAGGLLRKFLIAVAD